MAYTKCCQCCALFPSGWIEHTSCHECSHTTHWGCECEEVVVEEFCDSNVGETEVREEGSGSSGT